MSEMHVPGKGEWRRAHIEMPPDFHLDTSKVDVVQTLIDQIGWDDALTKINDTFDKNPNDPEARRQATLIIRLYDEKVKGLRDKLQH